jgi:hypothetical protein
MISLGKWPSSDSGWSIVENPPLTDIAGKGVRFGVFYNDSFIGSADSKEKAESLLHRKMEKSPSGYVSVSIG